MARTASRSPPLKFEEHKPGEYYRLTKNDAYWGDGQPKLDEIVYRAAAAGALVLAITATMANALRSLGIETNPNAAKAAIAARYNTP